MKKSKTAIYLACFDKSGPSKFKSTIGMKDKNEPTLDDLGLNEKVEFSNKISIAELQRQSEREIDDYRPAIKTVRERMVAMDIGAMLLSIVLPGAGHCLKGFWGRGAVWFAGVGSLYLASLIITPIPAVVAHICCIASATMVDLRD